MVLVALGWKCKMIGGLEKYGMNLGIAFQITDDLLDIIKSDEEIKKQGEAT